MARPVGRRGETRERTVAVALQLFGEHGVSGTSLSMIADALGVTKAAVYHQFSTKDEIVEAALLPVFSNIEAFVDAAEAEPGRPEQIQMALRGLVDAVVAHRHTAALLRSDPTVINVVHGRSPFREIIARLALLLHGPNPTVAERVAWSMIGGGIMLAAADVGLLDITDDELRESLYAVGIRLLP